MATFSDDEESLFFDARDDVSSVSDTDNDDNELNCGSGGSLVGCSFDVWNHGLESVKERRSKFLNRWFVDRDARENTEGLCGDDQVEGEEGGIGDCGGSGSRLGKYSFEDRFCSTRSSILYTCNDNVDCTKSMVLDESFVCRDGNLDRVMEGRIGQDRIMNENDEAEFVRTEESESTSGSSPLSQLAVNDKVKEVNGSGATVKRAKKGWLSKLRSFSCIVESPVAAANLRPHDDEGATLAKRVKVRQCGKKSKELSALYKGQEIKAHEGSILALKFSFDGQYLASAGEDGVVRVWRVVEEERCNELDILDIDPSCMYFKVNHLSELTPIFLSNEKMGKVKSLRKTQALACVIFPEKVFRVSEKPLHEFHGHDGEILDLAWSKNNFLLSSSVDKTVRLWQVGCEDCLKVYLHTDYVTCVQFNPVSDDHFVSGSIDGKTRIWSIHSRQVIDWTDTKEIVTAVCFQPDAQGVIVGSMTGNCRFYNMTDNHLELDAQICLTNKKLPCKRITGFQFYPQECSKLMVTCADSSVRVLQGHKVISKYKGPNNAGSHLSASFSSDGKHIISACEDSNVYVWNCIQSEKPARSQAKKVRSFEHFSANASVAIPWSGLKYRNSENGESENVWESHINNDHLSEDLPISSPNKFILSQGSFLEASKGSATWPEENLPEPSPLSTPFALHKSQYKFLKSSCQSSSHAWGLAIVTAGWDGRIRSYYNYGLPVTT